jgi:hypothetical protein
LKEEKGPNLQGKVWVSEGIVGKGKEEDGVKKKTKIGRENG